jgi:hypothetical protein
MESILVGYKILKRINSSLPLLPETSLAERPLLGEDIEYLLNRLGLKYKIKYFFHSFIIDMMLPPFISRPVLKAPNLINSGKKGNFFIAEVQ